MTILAWHFLAVTGLLRDGTAPPANGEWLRHDGALIMCEQGLHASVRAIDALRYTPGAVVCRVECGGLMETQSDKLVCAERRILWRADATEALRGFARWCALSVADKWDMPTVVREYLETGDESKRGAARAAAGAVWAAADAAWGAAGAVWAAADAASAARAAADAAWGAQNTELERRLTELAP